MNKVERVAVLGGGSWGATLASLLADKGHDVLLWEFDRRAAEILSTARRLAVLPDLILNPAVRVTSDIAEAADQRSTIVSAVPSHFVRSTMRSLRLGGFLMERAMVVSVTKGLEEQSFKRMSEVIREELRLDDGRIAVVSGPSHAEEVCRRLPTAVVASATDPGVVAQVQTLFSQDYFRVYAHADQIGVELAGSFKNIYAIACGISDGLGFGDNTRAAIVTRGLSEMTRLGVRLGADILTFFGLAGMGDLVVTCMSVHSRNHQLGEKIGKGKSPEHALKEMTMVAEGYKTAASAHQLALKHGFDCPLTREIYQVLYEGKSPRVSLRDLMQREPQGEWRGLQMGPERIKT
ncbi:MAG TPA: NAD(P)H-dependent glycerol-3-phosphate dehydrogenase [Elusimicrobiota bacterium]|nr:NAD(P)H-dependent glycerol-3-phosphate dehydrogenase [Elusimicrobiota bacterium]